MSVATGKMLFDQTGHRKYHTGVSALALFPMATDSSDAEIPDAPSDAGITITKSLYRVGVPWDGVTGVTDSPSGGDETELWADNIKYGSMRAAEKYGSTIEAYQYPEEFNECNGAVIQNGIVVGQQARRKFAYAYRSNVGNDQTTDAGEILHLVWNTSTSPSEHSNNTINDSPDAGTFSFSCSSDSVAYTKSANAANLKPCCTMDIDTTNLTNGKNNANYKYLCDCIYGRDADSTVEPAVAGIAPQMLSPDDVIAIMARALPSG